MSYTIGELAKLSGVTPRALRHYEDLGLISPRRSEADYRLYDQAQVDTLQQILFFREMGFSLEEIHSLVTDPAFDAVDALHRHLAALIQRQKQLESLIINVGQTIEEKEGKRKMKNQEKFQGFKKEALRKNEALYGEEIRGKYGTKTVEASNAKWMAMSQEEHEQLENLGEEIFQELKEAVQGQEDPAGSQGQKIAAMHKRWLIMTWPSYNKEAHLGVAEMYVGDPRFTAYYDKEVSGCAAFLRDAVAAFLEKDQ